MKRKGIITVIAAAFMVTGCGANNTNEPTMNDAPPATYGSVYDMAEYLESQGIPAEVNGTDIAGSTVYRLHVDGDKGGNQTYIHHDPEMHMSVFMENRHRNHAAHGDNWVVYCNRATEAAECGEIAVALGGELRTQM